MIEAKYQPREVHFRNQRIEEALYRFWGKSRDPKNLLLCYSACNLWQRQNTTTERYIFRNQRNEEALYTDFGANRETPKICCWNVTKSYNACNLWLTQNTTPERYIFVISASRRPYIPILGQIERPKKSAAGRLQKVTTLVTCDRGKIPLQRGTFS